MSIYRKIYEQNFGPIPEGYEIHHIDGDHSNNHPNNLKAVTVQEHYDIHFSQGDWSACALISTRLCMDLKILKEIRVKAAMHATKKSIEDGTHNFLGENHPAKLAVKNGTHLFLRKDWGQKVAERNRINAINGTHPANGPNNPFKKPQLKVRCPQCGKLGGEYSMKRWHFDKCRQQNDS